MIQRHYPDLEEALAALEARHNLRQLPPSAHCDGAFIENTAGKFLNLSSNDYLGLAGDTNLQQDFLASHSHERLGASSSRLLSGNHAAYQDVEQILAGLYERDAALVFNSGYHANLGIIPALVGPKDCVFADRLNHASLVDGIRLSGAKLLRFNHNDPAHLKVLLEKYRSRYRQALIVTESLFSMDGDKADLRTLCSLKEAYQARLYVDEAHAFGALGPRGLGECEVQGVIQDVDFIVGTFGKALAALGAFIVADRVVADFLVNAMRPFIFTTALPPLLVCWIHFLLQRLPGMLDLRRNLDTLQNSLRRDLAAQGLQTMGASHIIPVLVGENQRALAAARQLQSQGYLLFAIRPPTVPEGTARLRISLNAAIPPRTLQPLAQQVRDALDHQPVSTV